MLNLNVIVLFTIYYQHNESNEILFVFFSEGQLLPVVLGIFFHLVLLLDGGRRLRQLFIEWLSSDTAGVQRLFSVQTRTRLTSVSTAFSMAETGIHSNLLWKFIAPVKILGVSSPS